MPALTSPQSANPEGVLRFPLWPALAGQKKPSISVADAKTKTWWEEWEEFEAVRRGYYDPNTSRVDRVFQAGADFRGGRPWPPDPTGRLLQDLWEQFRNYVGLQHKPIITRRKQAPISDDDDSDDADAAPAPRPPVQVRERERRPPPPPRADGKVQYRRRRPFMPLGSAYEAAETAEAEDGLTWDEKLQLRYEDKDARMAAFLNDPETSMRVLFSHYFRDRGLIWSEQRCAAMPTLVAFFLRFLLRSYALPEPEHDAPLRRALALVETARAELPLIHRIGRAVPDALSAACAQCWGSMRAAPDWAVESVDSPATQRQKQVEEAEAARLDEAVKAALAAGDPFVIDSSTSIPAAEGDWAAEDAEDWGWAREPGAEGAPPGFWDRPLPALLPLLGPTALPLTHAPGVVEWSTRRIASLHAPLAPRCAAAGAEAVEEELERRFGRVVLAPLVGWEWDRNDQSDITRPVIPSTSRGAVVLDEAEEAPVGEDAVKPHNPFRDDITVLVSSEVIDVLHVGMGIGAYWVEIARQEDAVVSGKEGEEERPRYWYIDHVMHVLPSYHAEE